MNIITISAIAFHNEGVWIAQCVEYDIAVSATTLPKLRKAFERAVIANICVNESLGRSGLDGIPPAPSKFRDLFNNADTDLHPIKQAPSPAAIAIRDFRLAEVAWMISKQSGAFWNVREIVSLFQQMGCEIHTIEHTVKLDGDCVNVRYLQNPTNKAFVPFVDLGDDDFTSKWEVESWERRLAITIPKPPVTK
jgi:hypothetical protein